MKKFAVELKGILFKKSLLFMVLFFVPLFILTCFVPGITKPAARPADATELETALQAAETRLDNLSSAFEGLADITNNYRQELRNKWIAFGGYSNIGENAEGEDVGDGAQYLYWNFYHAEAIESERSYEIVDAYIALQPAFMIFYQAYQEYIAGMPLLLIKKQDYHPFIQGVETLHEYFTSTELDPLELNAMRGKCNDLRRDVNFLGIIDNMQPMRLATVPFNQVEGLKQKLFTINETRETIPQNTFDEVINYIDFCDTAYEYLTTHMKNYVIQNADFKTRVYYGFNGMGKKRAELKRFEYMLEKAKTNMDYSRPLAFGKAQHFPTGSTMFDFAYNGFLIITIALILLAIIITAFGNKITLPKLLACYTAILIVVALFCGAYLLTGFLIGGAVGPPVLFILFGKVIIMSQLQYFIMILAVLIFVLFFFITLTAGFKLLKCKKKVKGEKL